MAVLGSFTEFGLEHEYLSVDGATRNPIGILSASGFVVAYQDSSDSKHGTAKVGTVSGTVVTFGAETEYISANNFDINVEITVLDSTHFVVVYQDESDSGHGTARVGTVSGTTITFGPEHEFLSAGRAAFIGVATLDSTHFVVGYSDWSDLKRGKVKVGTVTGDTISFGSSQTLHSGGETISISMASFSATKFVAGYRKSGADDFHGATRIGTVAGDVITLASETEFRTGVNAQPGSISLDVLDTTSFVIGYKDSIDSNHGTVKIGTVAGTVITFGAESEYISTDGILGNKIKAIDDHSFVVIYIDASDSNHGGSQIGIVDGSDVTFGSENEFLSVDRPNFIHLGMLSSTKYVVAYTDETDSNHGTVKIGNIIDLTTTPGIPMRIINRLKKTHDHDPQLIAEFQDGVTSVTIQVWNVVNQDNTELVLASITCYQIGDTNNWGWSTEHLPFASGISGYQYYFEMTADTAEVQSREFHLTVPERGRWAYKEFLG